MVSNQGSDPLFQTTAIYLTLVGHQRKDNHENRNEDLQYMKINLQQQISTLEIHMDII